MTPSSSKHLYLIDGSGFIFRAYHALPPLTRSDGTPVGAVLGFCHMILKLLESHPIDHMAVIFDSARRNYRHDIYPDYKANRAAAPEDLIPQFSLIRKACEAFHLPQVEREGYEADDIIATYAKHAKSQGYEVIIVSSDKDLMQLIDDGIQMLDPLKNVPIVAEDVTKKFGVPPQKVLDVLALAGDSIDNIPGVPGIGLKTAAELINTFGSLENVLTKTDTIPQPQRRQNLIQHAEDARLSKKLAQLADDVPLSLPLEQMRLLQLDEPKVIEFLETQGFKNLIARLIKKGILSGAAQTEARAHHHEEDLQTYLTRVPKNYVLIQDIDVLRHWCYQAREQGYVAFDTETTDLNATKATLVGFSLALAPGHACYVPLRHDPTFGPQITFETALSLLKTLLENPAITVIGQNIKYDMRLMLRYGIEIATYEDTMIMSYDTDGTTHGHGLDELAALYFQHGMLTFDQVTKKEGRKQLTFDQVDLKTACHYAAEDADYTLRLYKVLQHRLLEKRAHTIYKTVDLPMVRILALMEHQGIKLDLQALATASQNFSERLSLLEKEIYAQTGRTFNIGSPKQLGEVLFHAMGLQSSKKGKSGLHSTSSDVLEDLAAQGHDVAEKILEWRQFSKLKSTYADALPLEIVSQTGRVHTSYGLTTTSTGRLSSSDPNLQNIPIRTEEGRKIRQAFIAEPGYKLVSLDYSQIELRLLAHMADIPSLIQSFKEGQDIHTKTASEVFGVPLDQVDPMLRRSAKAINFGIIYGISSFGLARQLKVSKTEAANYIDVYFKRYPGIRDYMEAKKQEARSYGYVQTLFGRKCYMAGLQDPNPGRRGFAERQAINAPLQGSAADIIKRAMRQMPSLLAPYNNALSLDDHKELDKTPKPIPLQSPGNVVSREGQLSLFEPLSTGNPSPSAEAPPVLKDLKLPAGVTWGFPSQSLQEAPLPSSPAESADSGKDFSSSLFLQAQSLIGPTARLLLQVHDELIFEIQENKIADLLPSLKKTMESVISLKVPLVVDTGVGDTWDAAH